MSETQLNHQENTEEQMIRNATWGAILLAAAGMLFFGFGIVEASFTDWQDYINVSAPLVLAIVSLASIPITRKKSAKIGSGMVFIANLILPITVTTLLNNIGWAAFIYTTISSALLIWRTMEPSSRRWAMVVTSFSLITIAVITLIQPSIQAPTPPELVIFVIGVTAILFVAFLIQFGRQMWKIGKIRTKLLISQILVVSLAVLTIGGFLTFNIANIVSQQIGTNSSIDAEQKVLKASEFLESAESDVIFLSESAALKTYLTLSASPNANFEEVAQALDNLDNEFYVFAQAKKIYDQIRFINSTGQEVVKVKTSRIGVSTVISDEDLQNAFGEYYFDDTFKLDKDGILISPLDLDVEGGRLKVPHKPVIRYGTPVFFNGEKVGVIVTNILAENLFNPLSETQYSTFMVDTDGYYMYHPEADKSWGRDIGTEIKLSEELPGVLPNLLAGKSTSFEVGDVSYFSASVVVPGEENPRWYIVNTLNNEQVIAPIANTLLPLIFLSVIVFGLIIAIANYLSHQITAPLSELTQTAEQMAAGNLFIESKITSQDEIGTLSKTFNTMGVQLSELISTLEQRILSRTRALETSTEVSRRLSTILDQDQLVREVVEQVREAFDYYHAHIYLFDESKEFLIMVGGTGKAGQTLLEEGHAVPKGRGLVGRAGNTNLPILVPDVTKADGWLPNPLLPETRSEAAIPIAIGENVLGVLDVQDNEVGGLMEEDVDLLQSIANQVASALKNAQAYQLTQKQMDRETLMTSINQQIQSTTNVENALQVAVREIGRALGTTTSISLARGNGSFGTDSLKGKFPN